MLFNSITFLYYFLPITLIIYFITPKKYKNLILLIASLIFYIYGEPKYVVLMLLDIFIAYIGGILIDKYKDKSIFRVFVCIPILLLIIFKYSDFFISNFNSLFNTKLNLLNLALPIGISFYTFQIISYLVDVYKGKVKCQKSFIKLATYVSLFPQLIAGPIVRYETVNEKLDDRKQSFSDFSYGIRRFIIGLAKKVLLANELARLVNIFSSTSEKTFIFYWLFAICYTLEIYLDFSGYSDMAIGLGRMFGFHFNENFDYPYTSKSITEFWRKWHMSLSSWFKDYVYIPLGGNRNGIKKQIRNIFIVWLLTGLWHGASWNFVIWGLFFGVILVIEKLWLKKFIDKLPSIFKSVYVMVLVIISFVIFNGENVISNLSGMFFINKSKFVDSYTLIYLKRYALVIIISIISSIPLLKNFINKLKDNKQFNKLINLIEPIYLVLLLILITSYLIDNSYNPFLYFRF